MKISFTLLLLFIVVFTRGQITVSSNNVKWNDYYAGNSSTEYDTFYSIKNTNFNKIHIRWKRIIDIMPSGWTTSVCDPTNCYPPSDNSDSSTLGSNASGSMQLHFFPNGVIGTGKVRLKVWDINDTSDVQTTTFTITTSASGTSVSNLTQHNPVSALYSSITHHVVVKGFQDAGVQVVQIYNMLGEKMISTPLYSNSGIEVNIDVSGLQTGVYFVRLINANNQPILTKKFIR